MEHRHLNTEAWSAAAIDSALERGSLADWKELFAVVRRNREVAALVLRVASKRKLEGSSMLAKALVERIAPGLGNLAVPSINVAETNGHDRQSRTRLPEK